MIKPSQSDLDRFAWRIDELRQEVGRRDPIILANNTAAKFKHLENNRGEFSFSFWGSKTVLSYPDLIAREENSDKELALFQQAMLLYYFRSASGAPINGQWISFSELPDGRFYNQAFHGYTGQELARHFQDEQAAFETAALKLGGVRQSIGDHSFKFQALPRVAILAVFWQGDEDFPSSYKLLFDASASHYLPTDGYAILGSTLTRQLIQASGL